MAGRCSELYHSGVSMGEERDTEKELGRGMLVTVTRTDVQDRRADQEQNLP